MHGSTTAGRSSRRLEACNSAATLGEGMRKRLCLGAVQTRPILMHRLLELLRLALREGPLRELCRLRDEHVRELLHTQSLRRRFRFGLVAMLNHLLRASLVPQQHTIRELHLNHLTEIGVVGLGLLQLPREQLGR